MSELNRAWSATAAGTGSGATATKDGAAGIAWIVTHVSGHTDTDSTLQLLDGETVLAEWKIDVSVEGFEIQVPPGLWVATTAATVTAVLASSTTDCQVNMAGFGIP